MEPRVPEQDLRERAERRVEQKRQFYQGLLAYGVVNVFLVLVWWTSGAGYPWFLWVIGGWGIGVVLHGVKAFAAPESGARHEKAVAAEMDRLRQ